MAALDLILPLPCLIARLQLWRPKATGGLSVVLISLLSTPVNWLMMTLARAKCIQPGERYGGKSQMDRRIQTCYGAFASHALAVLGILSVFVAFVAGWNGWGTSVVPMQRSHGERRGG